LGAESIALRECRAELSEEKAARLALWGVYTESCSILESARAELTECRAELERYKKADLQMLQQNARLEWLRTRVDADGFVTLSEVERCIKDDSVNDFRKALDSARAERDAALETSRLARGAADVALHESSGWMRACKLAEAERDTEKSWRVDKERLLRNQEQALARIADLEESSRRGASELCASHDRIAELEPWPGRAGTLAADLCKAEARIAELEARGQPVTWAELELGKKIARAVAELERMPLSTPEFALVVAARALKELR
jgi:hypothetical protein